MKSENGLLPSFEDGRGSAPERLLTERDLAFRWRVSVKTLQNARVAGTGLTFIKVGRAVRYRLGDILEFEDAHLQHSTTERQRGAPS